MTEARRLTPLRCWTDEEGKVWRAVPGFWGLYEVSDAGDVRSLRSHKILVARVDPKRGYPKVMLGVKHTFWLHTLVAMTFLGPRPVGMQTNHKDGNKLNAAASNLEYVTGTSNMKHASANGLMATGARHGARRRGRIRAYDVPLIRDRLASGATVSAIAREYGVTPPAIRAIKHGRTWKAVPA